MTISSLFSERLKEERKKLKLTQQTAAELCSTRRETWVRYESGAMSPGAEVLAALAAAGADVLYILTGVRLQTATEAKPANQREAALLDNYRNTPESLKRNAEETLSAFAQLQSKKKASGE